MHTFIWPTDATYGDVATNYLNYVLHHFGRESTVGFDGYDNVMSTKRAEQNRRTQANTSADVILGQSTNVTDSQASVLANRKNKTQLINMVKERLNSEGNKCCQS